MTAFFALIRKDLILFLSDRRALVISLALPIVIAAFFGSLFGGTAKTSAIDVAWCSRTRARSATASPPV